MSNNDIETAAIAEAPEKVDQAQTPPKPGLIPIALADNETGWGLELAGDALREAWNVYELPGDWMLRVKAVPVKIYAIFDDNGEQVFTETGAPRIVVQSETQIKVS